METVNFWRFSSFSSAPLWKQDASALLFYWGHIMKKMGERMKWERRGWLFPIWLAKLRESWETKERWQAEPTNHRFRKVQGLQFCDPSSSRESLWPHLPALGPRTLSCVQSAPARLLMVSALLCVTWPLLPQVTDFTAIVPARILAVCWHEGSQAFNYLQHFHSPMLAWGYVPPQLYSTTNLYMEGISIRNLSGSS